MAVPSMAVEYIEGDFVFAGEQKDTLVKYMGSDAVVTIPDHVKVIVNSAFKDNENVFSVFVPDSVSSIESEAFSNVNTIVYNGDAEGSRWGAKKRLKTTGVVDGNFIFEGDTLVSYLGTDPDVDIPNNVRVIDYAAFYDNTFINSINIPNSVTAIGDYAFYNCSLNPVIVPNSVTSIGKKAFYGTDTLFYAGPATGAKWGADRLINGSIIEGDFVYSSESKDTIVAYLGTDAAAVIPNTVTAIGADAFRECASLKSVIIPNSVTSIGGSAFKECTGLTSVSMPDSVITIGEEAFYGCTNLEGITLSNMISSIGHHAFYRCASLTSIVLPDSLSSIDQAVFAECTGLTSVTIPNSVASIDWMAFDDCNIKSVFVPNSVASIDRSAFGGTDTIYYGGPAAGANWGAKHRGKIQVGDFLYADKENESVIGYIGSYSDVVIPEQASYIQDSAFYNNDKLTSVTIHDSVKYIKQNAFDGCTSLRRINVPNSVVSIGENAFRGIDTVCYHVDNNIIPIIRDTLFIHNAKELNFYRILSAKGIIPNGKLEADIDLSTVCGIINGNSVSWEPIEIKNVSFDGGNHTISNLYVNQPDGSAALFRGYGLQISNLKLKNAYEKAEYAYGFAQASEAEYRNCHFDGEVTGDNCFVFSGKGSYAFNCSNYGTVIANEYAYVTDLTGGAYNCYNRGRVVSLEKKAVAFNNSAYNCYNAGTVVGAKGSVVFGEAFHSYNLKSDNSEDESKWQLDSLSFLSGAVTDSLNKYVSRSPEYIYSSDTVALLSWVQGEDGFPRFYFDEKDIESDTTVNVESTAKDSIWGLEMRGDFNSEGYISLSFYTNIDNEGDRFDGIKGYFYVHNEYERYFYVDHYLLSETGVACDYVQENDSVWKVTLDSVYYRNDIDSLALHVECHEGENGFNTNVLSWSKAASGDPANTSDVISQTLEVYVGNGTIYIANAEAKANIQVFDMNGKAVADAAADSNGKAELKHSVSKGVYVVTVGGQSAKAVVK